MRSSTSLLFICLSLTGLCAQDDDGNAVIRNSGYFIWDLGYLNEAEAGVDGSVYESVPFGHLMGGLVLNIQPTDKLTLTINPELKNYFPFPVRPGQAGGESAFKPKWLMYMEEAKAHWKLDDPVMPNWDVGAGYMVYKENPDTKIFGDYLFRSWIYPGILFTKFDYPQAQIFGVRLGNRLGESFRHNAFLLSEIKYYPYFDLSLAYTAAYSAGNLFEIGAGVNFRSLAPMRPSMTTPKGNVGSHSNVHKLVPYQENTLILDENGDPLQTVSILPAGPDSTEVVITYPESVGLPNESFKVQGQGVGWFGEQSIQALENPNTAMVYPQLSPTFTPYSFAGTILTGRIAFNTLGFLEETPLGRDALKIYFEVAVLGWKNYPGFYENRRERTPVMAGINLPTFNFLDHLTFETEYYPSKIFPSMGYRSSYNIPQPGIYKSNGKWNDPERATLDDWKWGISARKSFNGFALVGQVGTDHTKMMDYGGFDYDNNLTRPSHWYFQMRFIGGIF